MVPEAGWRSSERIGSADTRSLVHRSGEEKQFILAIVIMRLSLNEADWLLKAEGRRLLRLPIDGG